MGVPRGTRAPLNPLSSACSDCVSQDFIQQKIPFCCCGSVQGPAPRCRERTGEEHMETNQESLLKELELGTRGRIYAAFLKKKKSHPYVFSSESAKS